jgi:RND family efflux transporter MFP subunit
LVKTGAVSASDYDQIKATADAASAQLASAEAQEKVARDQGDYSLLLADSNGTVVQTSAEPGQVVGAGQTVVKLAHAGPREAAIYLPETIRPALGSVAHASLYGETADIPARLRQLSDAADPETRTFEARYVLGSVGAKAPLGATVTVQVPEPEASDPEEVPIAAITDRGNGPGVWVLNQKTSTVSFQKVKVVRLGQESAILSEGVQPGEQIVALGAHLLSDGQHVRIAEDKAALR